MFKIVDKQVLNENVVTFDILAPKVAKKAKPGQFIIFRLDEYGERIPLTISDYDREKGIVTIVVQKIGKSTKRLCMKQKGEYIQDFVGPLGEETKVDDSIKKIAVVGGGVGCAIAFPQAKYLHSIGKEVDIIAGFKNESLVILEDKMLKNSKNLYITTDDGSKGSKGFVTTKLDELIKEKGKYDLVITIGPLPMMKFVCEVTKKYDIKTIASMNSIMIDGTGMCGCCRVKVGGEIKFACVDGPDFDGSKIDFDELMQRNGTYREIEKEEEHKCNLIEKAEKYEINKSEKKVKMPEQEGTVRNKNFLEVSLGYSEEMAMEEARRCLQCKHKPCIKGCPVKVLIPEFIKEVSIGDFQKAYEIITSTNSLPAISGRVCPQETQCEEICVRGIKGESVAIGRLERFVADWYMENGKETIKKPKSNGKKVAVVGAGPSGLTCAGDLAKLGYEVTLYETFHEVGGVLVYGIPEFRLPNKVVKKEVDNLEKLGVKIELNTLVGKTITIDELLEEYEGVYLGTGAGLPKFMGIEGEGLVGVFSANEYLTRVNSMKAYLDKYDTTLKKVKRTVVVGGGNVAMDASRCAIRAGSDEVCIVYRRDEANMPARKEEIHHAKEEEIEFNLLTNPIKIIGDEKGNVKSIECIKMELTEPDANGRRGVKEIEGSNFTMEADSVIIAIGTNPNPLISRETKGLNTNNKGCVVVDDRGKTAIGRVYAGGDLTAGTATVIYAMGCGKEGASSIHNMLKE